MDSYYCPITDKITGLYNKETYRKYKYTLKSSSLVESGWSLVSVDLVGFLDSVRQWELQVLGQELLDVLSLDISSLFQFNNL